MNISQKIGRTLIIGFDAAYIHEKDFDKVKYYIDEGLIGGIILFNKNFRTKEDKNIKNLDQLQDLILNLKADSCHELLISIDQEGGFINRLKSLDEFNNQKSQLSVFHDFNEEECYQYISEYSKLMGNIGINLNFSPVVDIHFPESKIIGYYERAFSNDIQNIIKYAEQYIDAHRDNGIIPCLKHFPGHGSSYGDTHEGFVDASYRWSYDEMNPYKMLKNKAKMVMMSHLFISQIDDKNPASLSKKWIDILRSEIDFQGVVISDDFDMYAISKLYTQEEVFINAINAGIDICLFGNNISYNIDLPLQYNKTIMSAVNNGIIDEEKIHNSCIRIEDLLK
jgi:beta-N-acetylhexosaminidase